MAGSSFQEGMDLAGPRQRRADGIEAQLAIDGFPHRIIDAGDDPRDLKDLERDLGRHDVAIVAIGQRGEAVRRLDPRLAQYVLVDPIAEDHLTREIGAEPVKGLPIAVDHGDLMPCLGERQRGHRANPSATDDYQLHEWKTHSRSTGRGSDVPPPPREDRRRGSSPGWWRRHRAPVRSEPRTDQDQLPRK